MNTVMNDWVKVRLVCTGCRHEVELCVPVPRNVPAPLRCSPGGPAPINGAGTGSAFRCPRCHRCWQMDSSRLREEVATIVRKGGWGEHHRAGAVVVTC